MQIEDWPLTKIRPYPNNPRVLRNAAEKVADSIRDFGWRQPIVVDEQGVVIIGHSRLAAAKLLKAATAPVHVATGLPEDKVRALRLADNKTAEFAGWDEQKLADELQAVMAGLGSIASTGFSQSEVDAIEMQARSALEQITAAMAPAPAQPEQPAEDPPGAGDEPADPDPAELDAQTPPASDEPARPDMVPFNVLLTVEARQVLYDAIAAAKRRHGLEQTADALLVIARSYLSA
jgi:ParB-like chromosome segregation protein Spo0J